MHVCMHSYRSSMTTLENAVLNWIECCDLKKQTLEHSDVLTLDSIDNYLRGERNLRLFLKESALSYGLPLTSCVHVMRCDEEGHTCHGIETWGIGVDPVVALRLAALASTAVVGTHRQTNELVAKSLQICSWHEEPDVNT